jgi:membrane-associated HD superfamily phosphohydrolase
MLATLSLAIKLQLPNLYYIPYCIVPIIIRILFDTRLALNIHLLVVLIAGFFVPNSFEFAYYEITAGMVSIYSIKNLISREQFLISAVIITFTYFVAFGVSPDTRRVLSVDYRLDGLSAICGKCAAYLAGLSAYLYFEKVFAITSDITLIELTNTNAPLLREMAFSAPGTFQHSLQVANLAENAIYALAVMPYWLGQGLCIMILVKWRTLCSLLRTKARALTRTISCLTKKAPRSSSGT